MKREEMQVAALRDGTVIDHIPSDKVFQAVNLLDLDNLKSPVTIGYNYASGKMGTKGIIKIADKFFTDEELNRLSLVAPNVTLCIIKDYEVVKKFKVTLPSELIGLAKCPNPKCVTNNEPMATRFDVVDAENGVIKCRYCNREEKISNIKLL